MTAVLTTLQLQTAALIQAKAIAKSTADKADGLQNHAWGRAYLAGLYCKNAALMNVANQAYEARLMDLSGEASA